MNNWLMVPGVICFIIGGLWKNKIAISIGVGLIILGAFV